MPIDHDSLLRALLNERVKMIAYIRAIVRRWDVAEDVFQDVCVIAMEKREQIRDGQHLPAWLRTTARLSALNVLGKQENRLERLDDTLLNSMEAYWEPHDSTASSALSDALQECLKRLAEKARQIVQNRYTHGMSVEEMAEQSNRTVNSMYVTISRIHASLSDCIFRRLTADKGGSNA